MSVAVGVDLGSVAARAIAIDDSGDVVGLTRCEYEGRDTWPAGRGDSGSWLAAVEASLRDLGHQVPEAHAPAAVAVGGQSPTTVPVDGGLAVTVRHPAGRDAGGPVGQHLAQLDALRAERPGVEAVEGWDWLLSRLGAPTLQSKWPGDEFVPGFGELAPTGTVIGEITNGSVLAPGTLLVGGAADAYLAAWAGGIYRLGRAIDPGGATGGYAVAVESGVRVAGTWEFRSADAAVDVIGGPVASHGLMVEWVSRLVGLPVEQAIALASASPPGARGLLALPYLEGERSPRWNADLCAHISGIRSDTGPADAVRAVLEGCAYGLNHVKRLLDQAGASSTSVVLAGSSARSRLWCEIKASLFGVPVHIPSVTDLACYGAALAAGAGAGWWRAPGNEPGGTWPSPPMTVIDPIDEPAYTKGFERFVALGDAMEALESEGVSQS